MRWGGATSTTLATMLLLCACGGDDVPSGEPVDELVDNSVWAFDVEAPHDTHALHRPAFMDEGGCNPNTVIEESGVLELDTRLCAYFVVSQLSLTDVEAGDMLSLEWSHLDLDAAEPAEAHLALSLDGELQWETAVAIPNDPQIYHPSWMASRAYPAGSRVTLHLHNHGINNWSLHSLTRR